MRQKNRQGALDEIFDGLVPPAPPAGLKDDVISAAQSAWQNEPNSDLWTRLWYHRGLQVAWAGMVVLLLASHILVPSGRSIPDFVSVDARPDAEMAEFLRPVRIVALATPNLGRYSLEDSELIPLSDGGIG